MFLGCSDSYDKALADSYIPDSPEEIKDIDVNALISGVETDTESLTLNEAEDILKKAKAEIEKSDISEENKQTALTVIDKIEKEKFKDDMNNIISNNNTNSEECEDKVDNKGAIPPSVPSDSCI